MVASISLIPGPPLGPSYLITITSPFLYFCLDTASKASSSELKHKALPLKFVDFNPATFTIAPSGAKLPLSPTTPPVFDRGFFVE